MKDASIITRDQVMNIVAPAPTKTWNPIPHGTVLESMDMVFKSMGVGVQRETYTIKSEGMKLFGTFMLDVQYHGVNVSVGFRNSLDKSFALGICSGSHVIACSNMMFSGEFIEFRKHTASLDFDELLVLGGGAIGEAVARATKLIEWQNSLRAVELSLVNRKALTYDALKKGVVPAQRLMDFETAFRAELELNKRHDLYSWHGGVTRMIRNEGGFRIAERTAPLNTLVEAWRKNGGTQPFERLRLPGKIPAPIYS